jgi:proteasome regulatory subunit
MASGKVGDVMYGYTANSSPLEDENVVLRDTVGRLQGEIERYKKAPLMVCEVRELVNSNALIKIPNGNQFFVEIAEECGGIRPGDTVLVEQKNLMVVRKLNIQKRFNVDKFVIVEKPKVSWRDIGGLAEQVREIQEVVELPLKKPELFEQIGITPPKGILLHGPPGTGKTLLAKAVATATDSTFIEIVGSELVQKFVGEGAKLVKEIFEYAREKAPSIVFIDELDSLASRRLEIGTSGEREVQRTFMQLLAEIDGFEPLGNVKIIGCTNRKDILDPAILRAGRLERHISMPVPTKEARKEILRIHARRMNLNGISVPDIVSATEGFSGAEMKAVCTEAGYFAIREDRSIIRQGDFRAAIEKVRIKDEDQNSEHLAMFG